MSIFSNQYQEPNKWTMLGLVLMFGVSLPIFISGMYTTRNSYKNMDSISNIKNPNPKEINENATDEDLKILRDYNKESGKYAGLVLEIRKLNKVYVSFIFGTDSFWSSLVLLTALCVCQWVSGAFVYSLANPTMIVAPDEIIVFNIQAFILTFFLSLLVLCCPVCGLVYECIYIVAPIALLPLWALWGLTYIVENKPTYVLWHYCGLIVLYNFIWETKIPWLPQ